MGNSTLMYFYNFFQEDNIIVQKKSLVLEIIIRSAPSSPTELDNVFGLDFPEEKKHVKPFWFF